MDTTYALPRRMRIDPAPMLSREESCLTRYLSAFRYPFTSCNFSHVLLPITIFSADNENNRLSFVILKRILSLREENAD